MSAKTKPKPRERFRKAPFNPNRWQSKASEEAIHHAKVVASLSDDGLFAARLDLMGRELNYNNYGDRWAISRLAALQKEADRRSLTFATA